MEKPTNANKKINECAKEVVIEFCFINKNKSKSEENRLSRRFHEQKDTFTRNIIKAAKPYNRRNNINELTEKKYNDLKTTVKHYLLNCKKSYRDQLIQEWNQAKEADRQKWIRSVINYSKNDNDETYKKCIRKLYSKGEPMTRYSIDKWEKWEKKNGKVKYKVKYE